MSDAYEISRQIAVYKTDKVLLETNNCLKAAPADFPWHIHADGAQEGYSRIRLVAVDYSRGTGEHAVRAYMNLVPEEIKYLYMQLCFGFEEVNFAQQKIYQDKQRGGVVSSISVLRKGIAEEGTAMRYPWMVTIANGSGEVAFNKTGGQYCKKGSYQEEKRVTVRLDDVSFFSSLAELLR